MADFSPIQRRRVVAGSQRVAADMGAFMAEGRAMAGLGQSVAQTGDVFQELAERKQAVTNRKAIADASVMMSEAIDGLHSDMRAEGDRTRLESVRARRINDVRKRLFTEKVAPVVRQELEAQWSLFESKTKLAVMKEDATRLESEAKASVQRQITEHLRVGEMGGAVSAIRAAQADNLYRADEAEAMIAKLEPEFDRQQAHEMILHDPHEAVRQLQDTTDGGRFRNFKHLLPQDRQALLTHAKAAQNRDYTEFYNMVTLALTENTTTAEQRGQIWEQVSGMVAAGRLDEAHASALHNRLFPKDNLPDWSLVQPLHAAVMAVDVSGGEYGDAVVDLRRRIATENLPGSERGKLLDLLQNRFNPSSEVNRLEYKAAMDLIERRLQAGLLSKGKLEDGKPDESAHRKAHELRREVERIFRENPNADLDEVESRLNRRLNEDRDAQARGLFTPSYGRYSVGTERPGEPTGLTPSEQIRATLKRLKSGGKLEVQPARKPAKVETQFLPEGGPSL